MKPSAIGRVQGSSAFWFCCSIVFTANALMSAGHGAWIIALLQMLTGILAGTAALTVASRTSHSGEETDSPRVG